MKTPEVIEIFRQDLKKCNDQIKIALQKENGSFQKQVEEMVQAIKSASLILQATGVQELAFSLDEACRRVTNLVWLREVVSKGVDFFQRLSESGDPLSAEFHEEALNLAHDIKNLKGNSEDKKTHVKIDSDSVKQVDVSPEFTSDPTMSELFKAELENQSRILSDGLLEIERGDFSKFSTLLRAAHSIKGACRIVHIESLVRLAHALEEWLIRNEQKTSSISDSEIEMAFRAADFFSYMAQINKENFFSELDVKAQEIESITTQLTKGTESLQQTTIARRKEDKKEIVITEKTRAPQDRVLKVTAQNLNRLMGLAGETVVEANWLFPFKESLFRLKKHLNFLSKNLDLFRSSLGDFSLNEWAEHYLQDIYTELNQSRNLLSLKIADFETYINRHANLSDSLYREVIDSRMRPFSDGIQGFTRLVRDVSRELGKKVRLEMKGLGTPVDREILEKLEAPLVHLIRNALDHGIEMPEERLSEGKNEEGVLSIEAEQKSGMFLLSVSDDGGGIDLEKVKKKIIESNLATEDIIVKLQPHEVFEFLMLPGFSTASSVTEISGRGVGLNIVRNIVQELGGSIQVSSELGKGTSFRLQLPLTLSVIRALLVEIEGEPYAFPLARIDRTLVIPKEEIQTIENRHYYNFEGQNIGLISGSRILELRDNDAISEELCVVVLNDRHSSYGIIVDCFLGGREFVVEEIDARLGKIPDISSGAFMEDGTPVFILDIEDLVRSADHLLSEKGNAVSHGPIFPKKQGNIEKKKILVVDDSITVREVECRLLTKYGYEVETAFNGVDGWNAVRSRHFDLVITDIDMPRMNGVELVRAIRKDPKLKTLPVMIVSYKEDEEDKKAGIEAGANYYLTKSSFHDETLIAAVVELIGRAIKL